ncbi:Asp_protease_2 domain-containing protein [Cucumis melo var. makuwa]|uniref:Asp_protease_2 domain-containing protein n=1 Tax=Cucumis melo var. makuwa TaxID=1194695 RepID=A0A5D3DPX2_CUCMM|nr:Asp_protease_2 domain-containing protein [Cucumis melo var. makuwa]TYK25582.1 Asp_protease_2 domain-containing protein [Cucumis melo var. makuwa]
MGPLKFLSSLQKKVGETSGPMEKGQMNIEEDIPKLGECSRNVDLIVVRMDDFHVGSIFELTFTTIPLVDEQVETGTVSTEIQKVMNEYVDEMPHELPKSLPTRRGIDYELELDLGARPEWLHLS